MNAPPTPPVRVGAGHGWKWLGEALRMVRRWPGVFLPMGLIVGIVSLAPLGLGTLAILVLGPAFLAGIVIAADTATGGQRPAIHQLFTLFAEPRWRNQALKLCLPLLAGEFVALLVMGAAVLGAMARSRTTLEALQAQPQKLVALFTSGAVAGWIAVAMAVIVFAWTFVALAIPRIALQRRDGFVAMGEGFASVWRNIGACAVALVTLFLGLFVLMWLLMLSHALLVMQLGLYTALYAVAGPLLHAAWRDLRGTNGATKDHHHDAPPPSAPPPAGVLEA